MRKELHRIHFDNDQEITLAEFLSRWQECTGQRFANQLRQEDEDRYWEFETRLHRRARTLGGEKILKTEGAWHAIAQDLFAQFWNELVRSKRILSRAWRGR